MFETSITKVEAEVMRSYYLLILFEVCCLLFFCGYFFNMTFLSPSGGNGNCSYGGPVWVRPATPPYHLSAECASPWQVWLRLLIAGGWQDTHTTNPSLRYCIQRVWGLSSTMHDLLRLSTLNSMQNLERRVEPNGCYFSNI